MSDPLDLMADRARHEPLFFGYLLERYAQSQALDDAALAAHLGITLQTLRLLRLAGCPATEPSRLRLQIHLLAEAHGIQTGLLLEVVQQALAESPLPASAPSELLTPEPA
jgi:hypothetical protein